VSVALAPNGDAYFSDQPSSQVVKLSKGSVTVVAGNSIAGFSGDGGLAVMAALAGPAGLAIDNNGNLFIADQNNHRVRRVATDGTISTVAGTGVGGFSGDGGPAIAATLAFPSGVAVDASGNLYIADVGNRRVRLVNSSGNITTFAGNGSETSSGDGGLAINAGFIFPQNICLDTHGNLFVSDPADDTIRRINSSNIITTIAGIHQFGYSGDGGPATQAALAIPLGVSVDSNGNVYFADSGSNRVRSVNTSGTINSVVGNGQEVFSGDGGVASAAGLAAPSGTAVDSSGQLYIADTGNHRIRQVNSAGLINTIAGNGQADALRDGGPSRNATLSSPRNLAFDIAGNFYIADEGNQRIRQVATNGTISTVAGNGTIGYSGDGGPAVSAALAGPVGVALNAAGDLFIADTNNHRIRRVRSGMITTFAGNGYGGYAGDGGAAMAAELAYPAGVAVDSNGNLYIADTGNNRIRMVTPNGVITTIAGGAQGFSGDGGKATLATLNNPAAVALDSTGNIYIADTGNQRIRKIDPTGVITTVAGNGTTGYGGLGGPAMNASLNSPVAVAADSAGNVYIADTQSSRVLIVNSSKTINMFAGTGQSAFSGDGGLAVNAEIEYPSGLAIDSKGNVYLADRDNNRVREVLSSAPSFSVNPGMVSFSAPAGGAAAPAQAVSVTSQLNSAGLAYAGTTGLSFAVQMSVPWLSITPQSGALPASLQVTADPSQLGVGNNTGTITILAPNANPSTMNIPVRFTVGSGLPSQLAVSSQSLPFSLAQQASPATAQLTISNLGSGSARYTAVATAANGANWLQLSGPASGSVTPAAPVSLTVTVTPGSLAVGTYNGSIAVMGPDTGQTLTVAVILAITSAPPKILLSQLGFTFTAVAQGGTVLPQTLGILNSGAGTLNYSVQATTQSGGSGWLSVTSSSGVVTQPLVQISDVSVNVAASQLAPGTYYGQLVVTAAGASNSPQNALVVLDVLPPGSNPGPDVRPTGLVFIGVAGEESPGSQNVTVANVTGNPINVATSVASPSAPNLIASAPTNFAVPSQTPASIVVQPDFTSLSAGQYRVGILVYPDSGPSQTINVLSVIAPAGSTASDASADRVRPRTTPACPTKLLPQFTTTGLNSNLTVGYPASISAKIVDDCGNPMTSGTVVVSFNNGDPPIQLNTLRGGMWTQSWFPGYPTSSVTLTLVAAEPALNLTGSAISYAGAVQQGTQSPPMLTGSPLGGGTLTAGSFAPGDLILLKGTGLADSQASSSSNPPPVQLGGTQVAIGQAGFIPLLYADASQVVGLVPSTVTPGPQELVVQRDSTLGGQVDVIISATHPAILTADGSGQGQGLIYNSNGSAAMTLASSTPAQPGGTIIVYCSGLGATTANGNASNLPTLTVGGVPASIGYAGVAQPSSYPPSGAPTLLGLVSSSLGGLYQITATVPAGVNSSAALVVISSAGQTSQSGVTMAVGTAAQGNTPAISVVTTAFTPNSSGIAQNTWTIIQGANLVPATTPAGGVTWSTAPSFAQGQMPTTLNGISVTINGKPAYIYAFCSAAPAGSECNKGVDQINVLSPIDATLGSVQVVVNNNGAISQPFTTTLHAMIPALFNFDGSHVVATHLNYTDVGPSTLIPGYTTPASPGEQIIVYGSGFGIPAGATLIPGSASQSGTFSPFPTCTVGGTSATVAFAGILSPGLVQLNVDIPITAANGDDAISCTFNGVSTPVGNVVTVN
jgi:trimeric autotransporter adhesin